MGLNPRSAQIKKTETSVDKTREVNIKLDKVKCDFGVKSLTFVGNVVSEQKTTESAPLRSLL